MFVSGLYAQTYTSYEAEHMIKGQEPSFVRAKELKMIGISAKSLFPDNIDICLKEMLKDVTKGAYSA